MTNSKNVRSKGTSSVKRIPWAVVVDGLKKHGRWNLIDSTIRSKIFQRGNERLIAVRIGPRQWKAEYFVSGRLMDTSGSWNEEMVKKLVFEMGVLRT